MATRILLIRHGHSTANRDEIFGGQTDADLTPLGLEQAEKTAAFVRANYRVDAVYASTLQRAWKTAGVLAAPLGLPVTRDARLSEISGGLWDGMTFAKIRETYPEEFALWREDLSRVSPPGGETVADVQKRGLAALREIGETNDGKTVAVVSHRVMLRTLACAWEGRPLSEINACAWLSNGSVSELLFDGGRLIPVRIGQDAFMGDAVTRVHSIM